MPLGYAKWFEKAHIRCRNSADSCEPCRHSQCQPADHYENWWDQIKQHSYRQAEDPQWGQLIQFHDGTILQYATGVDWIRSLTDPSELADANALLNADWHNDRVPEPLFAPTQVRTKRRRRTA